MPAPRVTKKRANLQRVKLHRSYTIGELAECLGKHKNTVLGWRAKGLAPIDTGRPIMFQGAVVRAFLPPAMPAASAHASPAPSIALNAARHARLALGMVEYIPLKPGSGNLRALCGHCETVMHRRTREADLARIMPVCDVQFAQGQPRLSGRTTPSVNCDLARSA